MSTEWHRRWREGRLGFHRDEVHPDLVEYSERFLGGERRRVLVPLCGKTRDLAWLAEQGHEVVGVELVPAAVEAFFDEQDLTPERDEIHGLPVMRHGRLSVIMDDVFNVTVGKMGSFDRIWDRAALAALPPTVRPRYTAHLGRLAREGALLLQNFLEYDDEVMDGPPFSVTEQELHEHYGADRCELLDERDLIDESPRWRELGHDYWIVRTHLIRL